jgi:hypothetical protein
MSLGSFPEGRARLKEQVRADHGGVLGAMMTHDVGDHVVANFPIKVQVDVGQVGPARMQEAFQRQSEAKGVNVCDLQEKADERIAGRSPQRHAVTSPAGVAGNVANNEKIAGQSARFDDGQLIAEALACGQAFAEVAAA